MKKAFVFPGQGSQFIGMGKELYDTFSEARDVFQEVDDALSFKLSKIIFEGPEHDLTLTENTQPALMTVSLAVYRVLVKQGGLNLANTASYVAGHSLGEYSALCAAGAFSLADTARLLKIRGSAMQKAVPFGQGAMAAILGLDFEAAVKVAQEAAQTDICEAANDNAPGQVVVSGHKSSVERAIALATNHGAKRSILLPVSAPFHCALMEPAAIRMQEALGEVTISNISVPLITNITAKPISKAAEIKDALVKQVTGTVKWRESVEFMASQDVHSFYELGAGKVLGGLIKRIDKDSTSTSLCTPAEIEQALITL
ncbi:MAG: ACP S-malonyltransferase [Alphaproteobacteria bacterium]|nr:ACP S-malonyltransferase [Alphaproteobacteria bacterium]MBP9877383.1 ACP S-malonyltransferase [Alphaproteobacteria bacterium]